MSRPAKITIHLDALQNNFQQVRECAPNSFVMAMVKSNAYGHGIERIALALPMADAFGVACIEEGIALRTVGIQNPIVLLEGLFTADELQRAAADHFTLVVHQEWQVALLEQHPRLTPFDIWVKIDTGMHRLGFPPAQVLKIVERLSNCPSVKKPIGLMTHFAESDLLNRPTTLKQIEVFNTTTAHLPGPRSLSNSGGVMAWPQAHVDWVRPGIMLYGVSPFAGHPGHEYHLQPVMSLSSALIAIQPVKAGGRIGYGGDFTCPEDMLVGVVGIGYGDGYPQFAKNGTPVLVNGMICPLVGRVSMDMLMVDLHTQPKAKVGDPVLLWGPGLPVEMVAENNGTSGYELLTRMMQRVRVEVLS